MAILSLENQAVLKQYDREVKVRNIVHLKEMKGLLNTIFGIDNNQMSEISVYKPRDAMFPTDAYLESLRTRSSSIHYTITIHFPEITITNSLRKSHIIKDLYVRFYMDGNLKMRPLDEGEYEGSLFTGIRTTFTPEEWTAGYAHSHLPGVKTKFMKFCTGSGPINMVMMQLSSAYSSNNFKIFLHTIKIYVCHESLSGVPHRHMGNIGTSVMDIPVLNPSSEMTKQLMDVVLPLFKDQYRLLTTTINADRIAVAMTDEFTVLLAGSINTSIRALPDSGASILRGQNLDRFTVLRTTDGRYCSGEQANLPINLPTAPLFDFKGQPKSLYVGHGNTDTSIGGVIPRYTHPELATSLCGLFSKLLTASAIKLQNPG